MTQVSLFWGGTTIGDAGAATYGAPYSDDEFTDVLAMLLTYDRTAQGVVLTARAGYTGNLAVTNPSETTIRVADGIAMVDGKVYLNDASVDNVVAVPESGTNYYHVVLRKDFAAQTVRVAILGPSTTETPALAQVDGTLWEIGLASVNVTSAGEVTVTDQRQYTDALQVYHRQGGNSTNWGAPGVINYPPSSALSQIGVVVHEDDPFVGYGSVDVTFPIAFSGTPIIFLTGNTDFINDPQILPDLSYAPVLVTSSGFRVAWKMFGELAVSAITFNWLAVGPK